MKKVILSLLLLFVFVNSKAQITIDGLITDGITQKENLCSSLPLTLSSDADRTDVNIMYSLEKGEICDLFWLSFGPEGEKHKRMMQLLLNNMKKGLFDGRVVEGMGNCDIVFNLEDNSTAKLSLCYTMYEGDNSMPQFVQSYASLLTKDNFNEFSKLLKKDIKSFTLKINGKTISPVIKFRPKNKNTLAIMAKALNIPRLLELSVLGKNTSKTSNSTSNKANSQNVNGHEYVDLGLKSGTMWATCNVGAKNPHEIGMYFAWGEVEGTYTAKKKNGKGFRADNYKYMKKGNSNDVTKYCSNDKKYTLEDSDDAASVNWGRSWCMPTYEQAKELVDNCTYSFVKVQGRTCIKLVSKINNRYIIIPCGGDAHFLEISSKDSCFSIWLKDRINWGSDGSAANMNSVGDASAIYVHWNIWPRYEGLNIRPVLKSTK